MDRERMPKPGEIYNHFKNKPYQIITIATHSETGEPMVVYQALYGDFKTYVRPLEMFISEVDHKKYPEVQQKYRFEPWTIPSSEGANTNQAQTLKPVELVETNVPIEKGNQEKHIEDMVVEDKSSERADDHKEINVIVPEGTVNEILLKFLDAESYNRKLEVITSNVKHLNDRLINDMAVSLDCAVDEGPLDQRIQGLILCLQAMCRFEDRRTR